jgi:hypothetical protein
MRRGDKMCAMRGNGVPTQCWKWSYKFIEPGKPRGKIMKKLTKIAIALCITSIIATLVVLAAYNHKNDRQKKERPKINGKIVVMGGLEYDVFHVRSGEKCYKVYRSYAIYHTFCLPCERH